MLRLRLVLFSQLVADIAHYFTIVIMTDWSRLLVPAHMDWNIADYFGLQRRIIRFWRGGRRLKIIHKRNSSIGLSVMELV